jgi:predicted SAM-dependent methyltransferase
VIRSERGAFAPAAPVMGAPVKRLNWGCGDDTAPGWLNVDVKSEPGIDLSCDIRNGLPLQSANVDYIVSLHALQELTYPEVVPALTELRRVLKPGGVLRLGLPDLQKGIDAYLLGKDDYFQVDGDQVASRGGRFIIHMLWYGHSRTLFTADFTQELLMEAGFEEVVECRYGETASRFADIIELDNRQHESLFVEATKQIVHRKTEVPSQPTRTHGRSSASGKD